MPYNTATFAPTNGYHSQQSTPRAFSDINGNTPAQYAPGQQPQIYTVWPLAVLPGVNGPANVLPILGCILGRVGV